MNMSVFDFNIGDMVSHKTSSIPMVFCGIDKKKHELICTSLQFFRHEQE